MKKENVKKTQTTQETATPSVTAIYPPTCIADATLSNPMRLYDEHYSDLSLIVATEYGKLLVDEDNAHQTSVFAENVEDDKRLAIEQGDFEELHRWLNAEGVTVSEEDLIGVLYGIFLEYERSEKIDVITMLYQKLLRNADLRRCWDDMMCGVQVDHDEGNSMAKDDDGWPYND